MVLLILLLGICVDDPIMLVMELARLGPLNKYLRSHASSASIATVAMYMYQVSDVSYYLSSLISTSYWRIITTFHHLSFLSTGYGISGADEICTQGFGGKKCFSCQ